MILLKKVDPKNTKPPVGTKIILKIKKEKYLRRAEMTKSSEIRSDSYNKEGVKNYLLSEVEFWLDEIK